MGEQRLEVLSIGEALIDLISDTERGSLGEARSFHLYPGGRSCSPWAILSWVSLSHWRVPRKQHSSGSTGRWCI